MPPRKEKSSNPFKGRGKEASSTAESSKPKPDSSKSLQQKPDPAPNQSSDDRTNTFDNYFDGRRPESITAAGAMYNAASIQARESEKDEYEPTVWLRCTKCGCVWKPDNGILWCKNCPPGNKSEEVV